MLSRKSNPKPRKQSAKPPGVTSPSVRSLSIALRTMNKSRNPAKIVVFRDRSVRVLRPGCKSASKAASHRPARRLRKPSNRRPSFSTNNQQRPCPEPASPAENGKRKTENQPSPQRPCASARAAFDFDFDLDFPFTLHPSPLTCLSLRALARATAFDFKVTRL